MSFNNSETVNQITTSSQIQNQVGLEDSSSDVPRGQQGALIDINNQIQGAISGAQDAVEKTQNRFNQAFEEGITDLAATDVERVSEVHAISGPGLYVKYEDVNIASLNGKIVLNFHASWCTSCRRLENDIINSLIDIPSGVNLVKVNYDSEMALKNKYGITQQHTSVQVDNQGNLIKKWSGGNTLESIIIELQ